MAKFTNLYVRIEPDVKEQTEKVFDNPGISMSNAKLNPFAYFS